MGKLNPKNKSQIRLNVPDWGRDPVFIQHLIEKGLLSQARKTMHDEKWVKMWLDMGGKPEDPPTSEEPQAAPSDDERPKKKRASKKKSQPKKNPAPADGE